MITATSGLLSVIRRTSSWIPLQLYNPLYPHHDLAEHVAGKNLGEGRAGVGEPERRVDHRVYVGMFHEAQQAGEISREPIVLPCTRMSWKNTRVSSAPGWSPVVAPQIAIVPPGRTERTECPLRGGAHRLDNGVDLAREARSGLERGIRAEGQCTLALGLVARGDEHLQPGGVGELNGSGRPRRRLLPESESCRPV